ncbi:Ribonuclease/ribotoxin [Daldinia caldariorum]|uniref:Ribonuclease/ribotoxin n=1 Tax=Daldinia caldariorum TaxID=326644 RepID=UPI00200786EA|nr:Ribonuclease/ribotoxin [Daldinia caldariorum]KAI1464132.1 Ribonuclease/ribotoxin [Daldinia caldariorum]
MKPVSFITAALFFSLGHSLVVPVEDIKEIKDIEDSIDLSGIEDILEDRSLEDRAVRPKFTYVGFPRSATCAKQKYTKGQIHDAGDQAGKLQTRSKQLGKGKYPHVYHNRGREIKNFEKKCSGPLYEFPILQNHKVYLGTNPDDPGPDRVVVNVSKKNKKTGKVDITFCGLMTHTGAKNRGAFVQCRW